MNFRIGVQDIFEGAKNHEFWVIFGANEIKAKYRRSKFGQLWITLSVAIFILVIGVLYKGIFAADAGNYLAYMSVGYIVWLFMQSCVNFSTRTYIQAKPFLLQKSWPLSTFNFQLVYRELFVFAHNAILIPIIFLWVGLWPGFPGILFSILGLALTAFTAFWVAIIIAIIATRYRDIQPIVESLIRMAFFATPVIWTERNLGSFADWIILLNPFGYFLHIIRDPLLGVAVDLSYWLVSIGLSFVTMIFAILVLSVNKYRVSYWL